MLHLRRYAVAALFSLAIALPAASARANDEPARVVAGLGNSDLVISELEYMVVKLAGKQSAWVNSILPNIEIFLIGVANDQPIRFDLVLEPEFGQRMQAIIPVSNLNEFLTDNLDPIGIVPNRVRGDTTLHQLTGTVYEGWLRSLDQPAKYAVFFPKEVNDKPRFPKAENVPKTLPDLIGKHDQVVKDGYSSFLHLVNTAAGASARREAMKPVRELSLAKIEKAPDESRAAFELRKAWAEQQLLLFEQWLTEAAEVKAGLAVDQQKGIGKSAMHFAALPDTQLYKNIERIGTEPSQFQAIRSPENAILKLRVNIPIDPNRIEVYRRIYDLSRPVMKEKIDEDAALTDAEKATRKEMLDLVLDVFSASADKGAIDLFLDIFPDSQANTIVFGVRAAGRDKIEQVIDKLPQGVSRWSVEKNVAEVGDVKIHKVLMGDKIPPSIANFYGTSGETFVAASDDALWIAGGENSLEQLKSRLQTVQQAGSVTPDNNMVTWNMKVRPVLQHLHEFMNDDELQLTKRLRGDSSGSLRRRARENRQEDEQKDEDVPGRRARSALQNFEWEQTAIDALEGQPDTLDVVIRKSDKGTLTGPGMVEQGVLRALGMVIAKFAEENLQ